MNLATIYLHALQSTPNKPYLVVDENVQTYADLHQAVLDNARTLKQLGVQPGDRVALHMDNNIAIAPLYFACFYIGAIAMPISCFDTEVEAAYAIANCGAKILIVEPEMAYKIPAICNNAPGLKHCFVIGNTTEDLALSWEGQIDYSGTDMEPVDCAEDHPAVILYTSGSTGLPKGVTHSHGSLLHNAKNRIAAFEHDASHSFFILSKLCHGAGLSSQLVTLGQCGGTTICTREHSAKSAHALMGKWKPTFAGLSPSILREMLEDSSFDPAIYANIKSVYVGGDKAPLDLYALLKSKTGLSLREAMGMTECGGYLNCSPSMTPKPGSAGRPIPGTEIRIVDDEGKDVAQGTEGQLVVRTKAMMIGYWGEPEITAKTICDDWLQTGDLGHVDEDGYYFITGRLKDVIVRGTGNVSPAEVEKAVTEHPDVVQCCVFGIPDGDMGEAVVAAIVPTDLASAPTKTALTDFVTQRLAERKIPSHWLFFNELPVTDGMGKVDRATLKKMGLEQLGR